MTKTLSTVSHKIYNLNANEGFVMFLTSKSITCFINGFTSKRKSQLIVYLLNESEHIYWILDLENEVHSIWVIWTSGLQECKGEAKVGVLGQGRGAETLAFSMLPLPAAPAAMTHATFIKINKKLERSFK